MVFLNPLAPGYGMLQLDYGNEILIIMKVLALGGKTCVRHIWQKPTKLIVNGMW